MGLRDALGLRWERKRRLLAARLAARDLAPVRDRTAAIRRGDVLLASVVRNEAARLGPWLAHHRALGVAQFLIVDNGSTDGTAERLAAEPDVSLWRTGASYRRAGFGIDWINRLARVHAVGRWLVVADPDEFLIYPHCDARPLRALADHLAARGRRSMGALLVDLYGAGPGLETPCAPGEDPVAAAPFFDSSAYFLRVDPRYRNLWI